MAQNLSVILNHAVSTNMVMIFDTKISYNFNYLMYAYDLVLITNATGRVVYNYKLCLLIHSKLIGKNPNYSKSEIFLSKLV